MVKAEEQHSYEKRSSDSTAKKLVIIVDEKKLAKTLGDHNRYPSRIVPSATDQQSQRSEKSLEKTVLREAPARSDQS